MSMELAHKSENSPSHLKVESDHRIANHLTILAGMMRLQAESLRKRKKSLSGREAGLVMDEFCGRLETLAKVHRLLANKPEGTMIEVAEYLGGIAKNLVSCLATEGTTSLRYEFSASCRLSAEKAVALGLLIGELITNALKYAHPSGVAGVLKIKGSTQDDGTTTIEVTDDGVGLPEHINPLKNCGLGFRIIRALTEQLGAKISFENYGLGLNCVLQLPCPGPGLKLVS